MTRHSHIATKSSASWRYGATKVAGFGPIARGEDGEDGVIGLVMNKFNDDAYECLDSKPKRH